MKLQTSESGSSRSGIDLSYRDDAVRVQDDLFAHVNGQWLDNYDIPADRAVDGAFRALYDQAEVDVQTIIQEAADGDLQHGTDAQRIGDLFTSFMAADEVERVGLDAIADELLSLIHI